MRGAGSDRCVFNKRARLGGKKQKSAFPHLLKYVDKACTVLLYDKLK